MADGSNSLMSVPFQSCSSNKSEFLFIYLKVLSSEKQGRLKVVAMDGSPFKDVALVIIIGL
jgi:hypothetical protein